VALWDILEGLSPHARVALAVVPFLSAMALRVLLGKNRFTRIAISAATVWFAANVLITPYSVRMQTEIDSLSRIFR